MTLRSMVATLGLLMPLACGEGPSDSPFATDTADDGATSGPVGDEGETGSGTSAGTGSESDEGDSGLKFDAAAGDEGGGGMCGCGNSEWSYIWVANSGEGTVSKIDTRTLVEEGRYLTREDTKGSPSRTSVSLSGRRVAVANRKGGLMAIWSREEFCDPMNNGVPGLQTSKGKDDVLPWGEDDCIDWYTPFDYPSQRPVAWMAGDLDPDSCEYLNERVWTSGYKGGMNVAHRVAGDDGIVQDSVDVAGLGGGDFPIRGGYGGAVDSEGSFWISVFGQTSNSKVARVDAETLDVQVWTAPVPGYGITVDREDRVWLASTNGVGGVAARFDPASETWATAAGAPSSYAQSGIQVDAKGRVWVSYWSENFDGNGGLVHIDSDTMAVSPKMSIGMDGKGISIDVDGNVWVVAYNRALRIDPDTQEIDSYDGLNAAYTYSDMTGWALQNATCMPEG